MPGTQSGKYDVGQANFAVTSERLKVVDFATYVKDGQAFVSNKKSGLDKVTKLTDICGRKVATTPGSSLPADPREGCGRLRRGRREALRGGVLQGPVGDPARPAERQDRSLLRPDPEPAVHRRPPAEPHLPRRDQAPATWAS
ncbi:transporter substrate-binding domain-containing protein [Nocardioides convexus]|uniref:transporter substrate-binding domain-containing protein n=1 Tax=Nocardioides convexus TaxID=2712224 RepID=UPI0024181E7C|nr:transporter substrate-binding domain-containing protein [Nocardioides convexus]